MSKCGKIVSGAILINHASLLVIIDFQKYIPLFAKHDLKLFKFDNLLRFQNDLDVNFCKMPTTIIVKYFIKIKIFYNNYCVYRYA